MKSNEKNKQIKTTSKKQQMITNEKSSSKRKESLKRKREGSKTQVLMSSMFKPNFGVFSDASPVNYANNGIFSSANQNYNFTSPNTQVAVNDLIPEAVSEYITDL